MVKEVELDREILKQLGDAIGQIEQCMSDLSDEAYEALFTNTNAGDFYSKLKEVRMRASYVRSNPKHLRK